MTLRIRLKFASFVTVLLLGSAITWADAQTDLLYQQRASRFEGIKAKPVSGFDIELLSARVDYKDNSEQLGERLHVRLYLQQGAEAYIVVRELDNQHYYWLDRVTPGSPWKAGFDNVFDWPTGDVLQQLTAPRVRISDLGVVARLDQPTPGALEIVAPALFYQTQFPERVPGYVFHFRLREDAKVTGKIYRQADGRPIMSLDLGLQRGGRPFAVRWDVVSPPVQEGVYKLVLSGYMLSTNDPVSQVVQFYHRPLIK